MPLSKIWLFGPETRARVAYPTRASRAGVLAAGKGTRVKGAAGGVFRTGKTNAGAVSGAGGVGSASGPCGALSGVGKVWFCEGLCVEFPAACAGGLGGALCAVAWDAQNNSTERTKKEILPAVLIFRSRRRVPLKQPVKRNDAPGTLLTHISLISLRAQGDDDGRSSKNNQVMS